MRLMIDIPEDVYDHACSRSEDSNDGYTAMRAIAKGIPLPKGHGRLIDADELFLDIQTDEQMRLGEHLAWVRERIEDAPTIIEADKESEVEE